MGNKNTICRKCGKKYHVCVSCGIIHDWEWHYCSMECFQGSDECFQIKSSLKYYVEKCGAQTLHNLLNILEESDLSISDLSFIVGQIEKEKNEDM